MNRREKGITLIALVVTIVVLLILAGISISMLTGENGIISQAQGAKEKTEIAEEREKVELAAIGAASKNNYGEITEKNLEEELNQLIGKRDEDYTLIKNGNVFIVTYIDSNRSYTVDSNGKVTEIGERGISIKLILTYENKELITNELPNVKEVTSENIPIPEGFYYVGGTKDEGVVISDVAGDDLDNSKQGNQFVWVPVNQNQKLMLEVESKENITEIIITQPDGAKTTISVNGKTYNNEIEMTKNGVYEVEVKTATTSKTASKRVSSLYAQDVEFNTKNWTNHLSNYSKKAYDTTEEFLEEMSCNSIEEFLERENYDTIERYMYENSLYISDLKIELERFLRIDFASSYIDNNQNTESVNKYGGYYIGRYEAGDGTATSARTASTSDTNTLVSKKGAYVYNYITVDNAKSLSSGMYNGNGAVTSQLITGAGWDRTLNWLIETGEKNEEEIVFDSKTWGNYNNSIGDVGTNSGPSNMNYTTGRNEYWKANNIYDLAGNTWEWTQETYQSMNSFNRGGYYRVGGEVYPAGGRFYGNPDYQNSDASFRTQLYINI